MAADLEKEMRELKAELARIKERVERQAWGNPHDFAYRALAFVELIRDYHASTAPGVEMIRQMVEMLRVTATHRAGSQTAGVGAAFIYGLADLVEGVYLDNRYHVAVHAFAQKRRLEEQRQKNTNPNEGDEALGS